MQILIHTPAWVFALLAGLLAFGLVQTKNRKANRFAAYLLPVGMVALSLAGIQSSFGLKLVPVALWVTGFALVSFIGYRFFRDGRIAFDPDSNVFYIPGSWTPLMVMMAIFFTKYLFAVMQALNPDAASSPALAMALSLAYGCFSGYFSSRALNLVIRARAPVDHLASPS